GARALRVDTATFDRAQRALADAQLPARSASLDERSIKLRFEDTEQQLRARDVLQRELGDQFTVALSLLPATPHWLERLGAAPMYLGLDLRGGVHFLMEVDLESAVRRAEERYVDDLRSTLRTERVRYASIRRPVSGGVEIKLRDANQRAEARQVIERELPDLLLSDVDRDGNPYVMGVIRPEQLEELAAFALEQNITALRNRIDELGVAEPVVQRQGERRIVVQLPGVQDTARAKRILGRTATLEMHMVDEEHDVQAALAGSTPIGSQVYRQRDGSPILLKKPVIYSGDNIVDAAASLDTQTGGPIVSITLHARGA
ncbi:MAG: protein translocase subunit SecD, partial [Gammaproteobacteria bacterium]|nr:protein translocase subunit SecD [Gammaproteobacteria bacterium]NIV73811.1 protein translocase subunit SecD [Gammaproteobacteria bacterium]